MFKSSQQTLEEFKVVLLQLPKDCYSKPCETLSQATIGQHTRHIIELYQCLLSGFEFDEVCYDKRKRDKRIETDVDFAIYHLGQIQQLLEKPDKKLTMVYELNGNREEMESNYFREVMYNLEHTIHHQALIKVGINQLTHVMLPDSFGVAPSTIQYREQAV
ncbi:DinB family protein [Flagellimonas sp. CMM7]|uniref:DinB family protein n=1 Tax=Flagellimonas sp. CMM7 TaxID=2654676 RepID=UPI0013D1DB9D|nr:DinB family protein [Flagellimonas sp. CMM7]UII80310.1 DinB family protein [Flagellimonas sp. CMM7]